MIKLTKELIASLGLSESQSKVYLAALELGEASLQELSRKSEVKRTTIYHFIDELKDRLLITETKRKSRSLYSAVDPEQLIAIEKTRLDELNNLLPELSAIHNKAKNKPRVRFYEGLDGIKEIYTDTLKEKKPIVAWSDFEHTKKMMGSFMKEYPRDRARRSITLDWILPDTESAREYTKHDYGLLRETKFIKDAEYKTDINVYGNKVALISTQSTKPFAVLIEDENIAQTLRQAWQQLWDRL